MKIKKNVAILKKTRDISHVKFNLKHPRFVLAQISDQTSARVSC